jgi:hypothetical protein
MSALSSGGQTYLAKITLQGGLFADFKRLPIDRGWGVSNVT